MIAIVCALRCEAESLIQHFKLKAMTQKGVYPIYSDGRIFLIISGIGKMHAAAAVSYLYAISGERPLSAWLNVGVGGHSAYEVGKSFLAHQIVDLGSGRSFYPSMPWKNPDLTETIYTVDKVERNYSLSGIYEMEAAGFCSSAFSVSTAELVHCFKVISDNLTTPPEKDPHFIKEMIEGQINKLDHVIDQLSQLVEEMHSWNRIETPLAIFLEKWHFTKTEMFQLQRLIQRWEALNISEPVMDAQLLQSQNAKEALKCIDQKLDSYVFSHLRRKGNRSTS